MPLFRPRSIRAQILLIVLAGAILPLAMIGAWVTQRAVRSGKELLRLQLDGSALAIANALEEKWGFRRGELLLLAENASAQRVLTTDRAPQVDLDYLTQLYRQVAHVVPSFDYEDMAGRLRWSTTTLPPPTPSGGDNTGAAAAPVPSIAVDYVTRDDAGTPIGRLRARVAIPGLISTDSGRLAIPGGLLAVRDLGDGTLLTPATAEIAGDSGDITVAGKPWLSVRRRVAEPALELIVAAPTAAYVTPFERAGRVGFLAVLLVAIAAMVLSGYFTLRVTRPLENLVAASAAVSKGDLNRRVDVRGPSEIRGLAESFNTMTDSLKRTMDELSRRSALAAVGEFAASLAHEVRNGLTSLRVDLQRAEEKVEPKSTARELVSRSLAAVTHLDTTVTGALRVARSGTVQPERIDLREVLLGAAERAKPEFTTNAASLDVAAVTDEPLWVHGDAGALEQLFLNVFLNAGQALNGGGNASVSTSTANGHLVVAIADTGKGIPAEDVQRVLEPYYTTRPGGTGLGLPIARQIAVAHGGEITVESEVGRGTLVRVTLPRGDG